MNGPYMMINYTGQWLMEPPPFRIDGPQFRQTGFPAKFNRSSLRRDGKGYFPIKRETQDGQTVLQMQHSGTAYIPRADGWRRVGVKEATR